MKLGRLVLGALAVAGLPFGTDVTQYVYQTRKVFFPIRFVVLSDLHGQLYNDNMQELINLVKAENPDVILLPGDLFDEYSKDDNAFKLLDGLKKYPRIYVTGNHEERREDIRELINHLKEMGVTVLSKDSVVLRVYNTDIEIGGIPCRKEETDYTVEEVNQIFKTNHCRILLSHRPHWTSLYSKIDCDWIISGHAHGGQWCIPFTNIGLGAPQQGILPKYTSGVHALNHNHLLISRGLVRHYHHILPRLYNNPEIVVLTLKPKMNRIPVV